MLVLPVTRAHVNPLRRLTGSLFQRRTPCCPDEPSLTGKSALVTGATGGIGVETARGLLARGATVLIGCRSQTKGESVADRISASPAERARVAIVPMDLASLRTIGPAVDTTARYLDGKKLDILLENAGIWAQHYAVTSEGHEITFGTNVLGHFALRRALLSAGLLAPAARVVVVTGDIYILVSSCSADFVWHDGTGARLAYCRSKLGNLWIASELARRHPTLEVYVVHPGVIASGLGGDHGAVDRWFRSRVMLDAKRGAQMSLICATQPGLVRGGYYHNSRGLMLLDSRDPARDSVQAAQLWNTCEALCTA